MRSYQEHHANYIFRFKELNFPSVMELFCLLKIPKMPELQNLRISYKCENFDLSAIPFKDKLREKQRLEKNEKRKLEKEEYVIF